MTANILTLADSLPLTQGWVRVTQLRKEIKKLILSNRIDSKERKKKKTNSKRRRVYRKRKFLFKKDTVYIEKEKFRSKGHRVYRKRKNLFKTAPCISK